MKLPKVGFLSGHDERPTDNYGERSYSMFAQMRTFRHSLINQGFDYTTVTLDKDIPEDVDILVIAEMKKSLTDEEQARLNKYIERGGNLLIAGEPKRQEWMNPIVAPLGVRFMEGCRYNPHGISSRFAFDETHQRSRTALYCFNTLQSYGYGVTMPSVTGIECVEDKGFTVTPLFATDSVGSWNELTTTDFVDGKVVMEAEKGEVQQSYPTAVALSRKVGEKEQKIVVLGDADCISNGELTRTRAGRPSFNYYLIVGSFYWMSDAKRRLMSVVRRLQTHK